MALVLIVFAGIGFIRGWTRELATLAGLVLAWMAVVAIGPLLVAAINRMGLMLAFTLRGGFDMADPGPLLRSLHAQPLVDPSAPDTFLAILMASGIVGAYVAANRFTRGPIALSTQILGSLAGAINGYILLYVLLSYVSPDARLSLSINIAPAAVAELLAQQIVLLLGIAGALAIAVAVITLVRRSNGTRGGGRERARGRG